MALDKKGNTPPRQWLWITMNFEIMLRVLNLYTFMMLKDYSRYSVNDDVILDTPDRLTDLQNCLE